MERIYDVALVGLGLHGLTLLARFPSLLDLDIALIDRGGARGGAMSGYVSATNSYASKFLRPFAQSAAFAPVFARDAALAALAQRDEVVACDQIGAALTTLTGSLRQLPHAAFLDGEVIAIDIVGPAETLLRFADGRALRARAVVLATGRRETLHPSLRAHAARVLLSGAFLGGARGPRDSAAGSVAILGGSHSAFSTLEVLFDDHDPPPFAIDVFHREPIALYYRSAQAARDEPRTPGERMFDLAAHTCPETGAVFRDSGMRGRAKALFRRIAAGEIAHVRLRSMTDVADLGSVLDGYDWIIQALGARPQLPRVTRAGVMLVDDEVRGALDTDATHRLLADGAPTPIHLLRVKPTAAADKDNNPAAHDAYPAIAASVLAGAPRGRDSGKEAARGATV